MNLRKPALEAFSPSLGGGFSIRVPSGVRSLKEKLEQNGKGIHKGYGQSYGNGKGTDAGQKKLSTASESEKVFAKILNEFLVFRSPKNKCF